MTSSPTTCPRCGTPLAPSSPAGLCPRCLLAMNLRTRTMPTGEQPSSSPPPAPAELEAKFPQFEILECLGRGGMGVVYKARQKALDRIVAIKILAGEFQDDPGFASRFEKEAKLLARLNHPNIVTIHDFGHAGGLFHIVMEYIDGVNVRDLLRDGRLEPEQALAIVPPICDALQFAHDHGVVHRDIKPENILLDREGRVKIADFGIATIAGEAADRSGTPDYMAPEISSHSSAIDHRADIYSLGVVLYEMLTGRRPDKQIEVPSSRVHLDVKIDEIVLRALQGKPELRYQTAGEFKTIVATVASPSSSSKTPPPPPPPPSPATPAPVPKPRQEPVPLAARVQAQPRVIDQRLSWIFLVVTFVGIPLLMSIVRPSEQDTVFLLGIACALASLVFAIRARRSRTGRAVLAVWATLIVGAAMLLFLYFVPAKKAAEAEAEADLQQSRIQMDQARERARELEERVNAARNATGAGKGPDGRVEPCIRIDINQGRDVEINGIAFADKEIQRSLEGIAKDRWELPVRIEGASHRFSEHTLGRVLQACQITGLGKVSFCHTPDGRTESTAPPVPIAIGSDNSVSIDDTPVVEDLRMVLDKMAAVDPLRSVRIIALSLDAMPSTASMRVVGRAVQIIRLCKEAGFRRFFFTTEALVARAWQDQAQASAGHVLPEPLPPSPIYVGLAPDGSTVLEGMTLDRDKLLVALEKLASTDPGRSLQIEAATEVPHAKLLELLDLCKRAGVNNVSVVQAVWKQSPTGGAQPAPADPPPAHGKTVRIIIDAEGATWLDGRAMQKDEILAALRKLKEDDKLIPYVEIEPDPALPYAKVLPVLELCHQAAVTNVSVLQPVLEEVPPLPAAGPDKPTGSLLPEVEPIRIRIAADESLTLDGESVSLVQLRNKLVAIAREGGKERPVVVSGRPTVRAKRIEEVMEACGNADLSHISLEKATEHLRDIDLTIALKSYETLQTRLRDARLDRELLAAGGSGEGNEEVIKAERLITTLHQQVDEERAKIEKIQSETAPNK